MANIVLGAVGGFVGGPIGAMVGGAIGSVVDRHVFAPSLRREGPRLQDLAVQSSAYGAALPLVYGRTRVAGNVIWSTGLKERRTEEKQGGGKRGSVTTVSYVYSASFAVALSARPIRSVGRVWADGKLIRGTAGQLTVGGRMRVYTGHEAQMPDPVIEAAEGVGRAPAYRGLAYVVFEDLALADFANRIPLLTFEVVADDAPEIGPEVAPGISVAAIAQDLCARAGLAATAGAAVDKVRGFAVGRESTAGQAVQALEALSPLYVSDAGTGGVTVADRAAQAAVLVARRDLGAAAEGEAAPRRSVMRVGEAGVPREVGLSYLDAARDYQAGLQRARRLNAVGGTQDRLELPAVLDAHTAKQAAERLLARRWRRRAPMTLALPWRYLGLTAGDALRLEDGGEDELWQAREVTVEAGRVVVSAVPVSPEDEVSTAEAEPGVVAPQPDVPHGATTLHVLDLPPISTTLAAGPVLHLAVAGESEGWRRASVAVSLDGGFDYGAAADIPARTVMGVATTVLPPGETALWDRRSTVEVALLAGDMALESRSEASVLAGANLCLIGEELVQFATAELLPSGRYRLSGLLRGRRGTEAAVLAHAAGERFVLLSGAALVPYDAGLARLGQTLMFKAMSPHETLEDVAGQGVTVTARGLRPLSPVHVRAWRDGAGDVRLTWVRRSRQGFDWVDGADAPLAEEAEVYDVQILKDGAVRRQWRVSAPQAVYAAAEQVEDFGALATALDVRVAQVSALAGPGAAAAVQAVL